MAQARRADAPVEQGVVHRVKHAIANTRQHREPGQHGVAGAGRKTKRRQAEQGQAAEQDGPGSEAVHHKARARLHRTRHHEKDRHEEAQFGVADLEGVLEPGEQRRQQQLAVVADEVGNADQADDAGVSAQRGGGGQAGGGCRGHGGIVVLRPLFWNATERQLSANLRQMPVARH